MKLRRLAVNQFKRFTAPTQLGELGDGLNLVVGPERTWQVYLVGRSASRVV